MAKNKDLRWLGFKLISGIPEEIPSLDCNNIADIHEYFKEPFDVQFNKNIVDEIESEQNSRFYYPLNFLNFLYKQAQYAISRSPSRLVKHLDGLLINKGQRALLYKYLIDLLNLDIIVLLNIFKGIAFHENWRTTVKRIDYEISIIEAEFEEADKMDELWNKYDWDRIKVELEGIESKQNKLVYLNNLKYDYFVDYENANENIDYIDITRKCNFEIERLQNLIKIENGYQEEMNTENGTHLNSQYNKEQLISIFLYSVGKKFIKCTEDDFLFWFKGIGAKGKKIKWRYLKGGRNETPNRAALKYYCEKLYPEIKPADINRVFDIMVDSNNKITSSYPDIDKIFENL